MNTEIKLSEELVSNKIYYIRNQKVMLDRDLALLYGMETKRLKEQVKRNLSRFPDDFMFELTKEEFENWRSQFATSNSEKMGLRYAPMAFSEHGVLMLSSVLNSDKAIHPRQSRTERS
jgi:ORF6N domain